MKRTSISPVIYGSEEEPIDEECRSICDALNSLGGIETISSCCGHGYAPFRIYFVADTIEDLKPILRTIDEDENWKMRIDMAPGNEEIYFVLEGVKGTFAFIAAQRLAKLIISPSVEIEGKP